MTSPPIRVLIVDDDYRVAGIHAAYIQQTDGFVVAGEARTATEARSTAAELKPDLVLMDIYLPDGDGLEVVRSLREQPNPADVIVISAARDLASVRAAMQLGAVHYVIKPFGYEVLAQRLTMYQRLHRHIGGIAGVSDQADVDGLFDLLRAPLTAGTRPPKGHSAPTLELVRDAVAASEMAISAAEVSEQIGVSRPTAQRYLNYLERQGVVKLQLRYGATGRPEHRYRICS